MASKLTIDDIRAYLERQRKETLLKLLMDQVSSDEQLYDRLLLRVAQEAAGGPDLAAFQQAIDRAVDTDGYVEYAEASDYAQRIDAVIGSIADLIPDGYAVAARELTEYLLEQLEPHLDEVDDSDVYMSSVMESIQTLYYEACEAEPPDPIELAAWLFEQESRSDWTFHGAVTRYADLLGASGLEEYRRLATLEWSKITPLGPGETDKAGYGRRARITSMMEALARQSGDIEDLVAIKSRDLAHSHNFLAIAQLYVEHGKPDQGLAWAERGLAAFPTTTDSRLVTFLVEQYRLRERHDDALALLWRQFQERPSLQSYQPLKVYTEPLGLWPMWREKAQALLRTPVASPPTRPSPWYRAPDRSELVRILLWEGEVEIAWQEAQAGGCSNDLWMQLAAAREQDHPEDSLLIYRRRIEPMIEPTTNGDYDAPMRLIAKVGELLKRMGREQESRDYVQHLRVTYKRKRNLMKLLDTL